MFTTVKLISLSFSKSNTTLLGKSASLILYPSGILVSLSVCVPPLIFSKTNVPFESVVPLPTTSPSKLTNSNSAPSSGFEFPFSSFPTLEITTLPLYFAKSPSALPPELKF